MTGQWKKLPDKFLERLRRLVPTDQIEGVLESFTIPKPTTFRANTLKISPKDLQQQLSRDGFELEKVTWCPVAFILKNRSQKELTETSFYKEGDLYLQSLSSLIPTLVLKPQPGEKVLDLCAAPGSKTTQMAALMANQGEIFANDKSHLRNYKLKSNLQLQGVKMARVLEYPGEIFWKTFPEQFDKVLLDAPCSLEGRFQADDPKSFKDWSTQKIKDLSEQQKWLLRSAVSCTKPGGLIVYSTCTLAPEENEAVIDWILKKEKGKAELEPISIPQLSTSTALPRWNEKEFDRSVQKSIRILPSTTREGFFVAKIRKCQSNVTSKNTTVIN